MLVDMAKQTEETLSTLHDAAIDRFLKNGVAVFESGDVYNVTTFNYNTGVRYALDEFEEKDFRLINTDEDLENNAGTDDVTWTIEADRLIMTYTIENLQVEYNFTSGNKIITDILPEPGRIPYDVYPRLDTRPEGYSFKEIFFFSHHWMSQLLSLNGVRIYSADDAIAFHDRGFDKNKNTNMLNVIILLHNAGIIQKDEAKYVRHPRFVELYRMPRYNLEDMTTEQIPFDPNERDMMGYDIYEGHYTKIRLIKKIIDQMIRG